MKKIAVGCYPQGSPEYVIRHAKWSQSRGRKPSAQLINPWNGRVISNPRQALLAARSLMAVVWPKVGPVSCVLDAIWDNLQFVARVTSAFNGVEIVAVKGDTRQSIQAQFDQKSAAVEEAWHNSPAYAEMVRKQKENLRAAKQTLKELVARLPELDFTDEEQVIDWLYELQPASELRGTVVPAKKIVATFKRHGYLPGVNQGEAFNSDDRDSHLRWLIGDALVCLEVERKVHPMYRVFVDRYREKFSTPPGHSKRIEDAICRIIGQSKERHTVLLRGEGSFYEWSQLEIGRMAIDLFTVVTRIPNIPELVVVCGAYTKRQILDAILGGCTFTCQVVHLGHEGQIIYHEQPIENNQEQEVSCQ